MLATATQLVACKLLLPAAEPEPEVLWLGGTIAEKGRERRTRNLDGWMDSIWFRWQYGWLYLSPRVAS